ncbi:MAG: phosphoribosylformylglycinamidine synthase [Acidobacteria bacterium]|nr:phosphoribosylformylglycinamidine synthase [Acidobacteriota bacterium]NIM62785.1 phosphoribosylformylglycinamidine synthase [Acidobacteriota bacterium]NIO60941.1 phosphoribosylformylglycinamidine synthase [Acidobacteriota bacterium]NIQ31411.1 phosphoribosylformylglycinamidine synthase [Acidobacteriota bacterium]NIQ87410.1 phosphoribosylformylglycinamidine synthase [Acidobacteriota bacterium]
MVDALKTFAELPAEEKAAGRRRVRVLILTGLGLNCEVETAEAFRLVGARPEQVHLLDLLDGKDAARLSDYHVLAFIGGFAFGDHLGAGFVFANKIRYRLYDQLLEFIEGGGLALGICNGFQTMVRLGMLPGLDGDYRTPRATLAPNDRLGYRDAWVRLAFDDASPCVWTRGLTQLELPARHGEGKFLAESDELLETLERCGQVAARYVDETGAPTETWPDNPNGSPRGVAGVCDPSGRLFGLMPHPDAYLYPFHHPRWERMQANGDLPAEGAGLTIFRNGVDAAAALSGG